MKHSFSSSIDESLAGRTQEPVHVEKESSPTETIQSTTQPIFRVEEIEEKPRVKKAQTAKKQSAAGRPALEKGKKKIQIALTVSPETKASFEEWAENKPRSATNYISEYIEEHIEEIKNFYDRK